MCKITQEQVTAEWYNKPKDIPFGKYITDKYNIKDKVLEVESNDNRAYYRLVKIVWFNSLKK